MKFTPIALAAALVAGLISAPALAAPAASPGAATSAGQAAPTRPNPNERPNFIVIQTDDMTVEDLETMPYVKELIGAQGATFDQMLTPFALCCPSRAAMMTGCYPHNTKVQSNFPPEGGFLPWELNNGRDHTAAYLKDAGYHTVHVGKYINGYGMYNRPVDRIPAGWSEWYGTSDPSTYQMYGYLMNEPDGPHLYGDFETEDEKNYGSDVYTSKALGVIERAAADPDPFLLQVAYLAPHVETKPLTDGTWKDSWADVDKPEEGSGITIESIPPRPALRHQDLLPDVQLTKDPSFNEADTSDKHPIIADLPLLSDEEIHELEVDNRQRKLSLLAVDEGVRDMVEMLRQTGQLDNTYITFMGDNGYLLGQHRISYGKYFPYEPALRIPTVMTGPGIIKGQNITGMAFEIDIAPTILELAGVIPDRTPDGISLVPQLTQGKPMPKRTLLLSSGPQQSASGTELPRFDGVRTDRYSWWVYEDGFEEMYDLVRDPYQMESVADDPAYLKTKLGLIAQWHRLKDCEGPECYPLAAAASAVTDGTEASRTVPVTVDVPVATVPSPGQDGMAGTMLMRVGKSAPIRVMIDTGFSGLVLFPGAWKARPGGVSLTRQAISTQVAGSELNGVLGAATMTIGNVSTTRELPFQMLDGDSPIVTRWTAKGVYGLIGLGTTGGQMTNPVTALPGELGTRWSLTLGGNPVTRRAGVGHLVLGAPDSEDAVAEFQLPSLGNDGNGVRLWNDRAVPACWTFGLGEAKCVNTWFDAALQPMVAKGTVFSDVPTNAAKQVRAGTQVRLSDNGGDSVAWDFRAGRTASLNEVRVATKGRGLVNTGNAPFFQFVITYDVNRGRLSLTPAAWAPPADTGARGR